jgi:ribosomal protein S21
MSVRVEVRDGEEVQKALRRLARLAFQTQQRPWYKRSRGFYEKPSRLRHKRAYVERLKHGPAGWFRPLYLRMELQRQLLRGDPCRGAFGMGHARHWGYIAQAQSLGGREAVAELKASRRLRQPE